MFASVLKASSRLQTLAVACLLTLVLGGTAFADAFSSGKAAEERGNYEEAATWYRQAADQGDLKARIRLGAFYEDGKGVPQNYAEAIRWYRMAAEQGDVGSQYGLGFLYSTGRGVPRNPNEAAKWYRMAANQGSLFARARLSVLVAKGQDLPNGGTQAKIPPPFVATANAIARGEAAHTLGHDDEAARWFRLAADRGDALGQSRLATMFKDGLGVPKNPAEAAIWFRKAADQGNAGAQIELANLYKSGLGVPLDLAEALRFYRLASAQPGFESAGSSVAEIEALLTPKPTGDAKPTGDIKRLSSQDPAASAPTVVPAGQRRVALVVANGAYAGTPLANPSVDAGIVAASLEAMGFKVEVARDADLATFGDALSSFRERAKGADVALFYFAGHGFALPDGLKPRNYLMSTSADLSSRSDLVLRAGGVPLDEVVDGIAGAAKITLVFVDACRKDPQAKRGVAEGRGLARIEATGLTNVFIGLSTRIDQTAADGDPGKGSPFARAFAQAMPQKALRLDDAFREMRKAVMEETGGKQLPDVQQDDLDVPLVLMDGK